MGLDVSARPGSARSSWAQSVLVRPVDITVRDLWGWMAILDTDITVIYLLYH